MGGKSEVLIQLVACWRKAAGASKEGYGEKNTHALVIR